MSNINKTINIVDYGVGNLRSIINSIKAIGKIPRIINNAEDVLTSNYLILPGVGAFHKGMKELESKGLDTAIVKYAKTGRPLLGICLGMQLFLSEGEEFGLRKGLNLIPGRVVSFKSMGSFDNKQFKIPHMGWNGLSFLSQVFSERFNIPNGAEVYFLHSFCAQLKDPEHITAMSEYGGIEFCSIIQRDNIIGFQFHPEKSGNIGLKFLRFFCNSLN